MSETTSSLRAFVNRRPFVAALTALPLVWVVAAVGGLYATLARVAVSWTPGADVWFLGRDFAVFYTGGTFAREGAWPALYDLGLFTARFNEITGLHLPTGGPVFRYPPPTALLFGPLTSQPLGMSLALWTVLGCASYVAAVKLLRLSPLPALLALFSVPVYGALALGQNSLLFLVVFAAAAVAVRRRRPMWVGLILGLLVLKPQLALGPAVWWLSSPVRRRRELTGALLSGGSLAAVAFAIAPEAWPTYLQRLPTLADPGPTNRVWYLSGLDFFRMLTGDGRAATGAWLMLIVIVLFWSVTTFRRFRNDGELSLAVAVIVTLLATPHVVVYDWVLLLVPGSVFWRRLPGSRPRLVAAGVVLDFVALIGPDVTAPQIERFAVGFHPAYPLLVVAALLTLGAKPSMPRTRQEGVTAPSDDPPASSPTPELEGRPSPSGT